MATVTRSYRKGAAREACLALLYGTILAVGGVGLTTFGLCKVLDIKSFVDFRLKCELLFGKKRN